MSVNRKEWRERYTHCVANLLIGVTAIVGNCEHNNQPQLLKLNCNCSLHQKLGHHLASLQLAYWD